MRMSPSVQIRKLRFLMKSIKLKKRIHKKRRNMIQSDHEPQQMRKKPKIENLSSLENDMTPGVQGAHRAKKKKRLKSRL